MKDILRLIDHTLLKPDATNSMIEDLCNEAIEHNFYAVCVNPYFVNWPGYTRDSNIKVATVIDFLASTKEVKALRP